jgi:hypothetical protein
MDVQYTDYQKQDSESHDSGALLHERMPPTGSHARGVDIHQSLICGHANASGNYID